MRAALVAIVLVAACSDSAPSSPDGPPPDAAGPAPRSLVGWVAGSGFVFRGKVTQLEAATEPQPPDFADPEHLWNPANMIVVEPERVSLDAIELPLLPGSRHTMILQTSASELTVGQELYFFGRLYIIGATLVMVEVGRLESDLPFDRVHQVVHETRRYLLDRALTDRMLLADRVIWATVTAVEPLPGPDTESGPWWWSATLAPRRTLRGPVEIDPLVVHFDGGANECCYDWPKLHVGDQALYLLQPDTLSDLPDARFVLDNPIDQQALTEELRLRSLLASNPVPPLL
jgi:hypothetical protein